MRHIDPCEYFRVGDVWMSPRGSLYRVTKRLGPWVTLEDEGVGDLGMRESSIVNRDHDGDDWCVATVHSGLANAHLIAAAPDLYSVAANVVSVLERDFRLSGRDDDYIYDELGSSLSSLYFAARSAAAKARGEG